MALFKNLTSEGHEEVQDRLGGSRILDTDVYAGKVKVAYAGASEGGAQNVTLILALESGQEYRETIYVTDKTGKNWFASKQDENKKVPLPGFTIIDDLCLIATDAPLSEQDAEEKVINIYDYEAKKEMPKSVPVLTGLTGVDVLVGIERSLENKSEKTDKGYQPIADTREVNNIVKVFHPELKITVPEAKAGKTEADFFPKWVEKNKGNVRDKRTIKDGEAGKSGRPGQGSGPPQASNGGEPRKSLFGAKS